MEVDRSRSDDLQLRSSGTLVGQRKQLPWPEGRSFKILSIDGGGIRGVLPAKVLAELESRYLGGESIGSYFDLIAGTSTGGIIALGLSVGKRAREILNLYEAKASTIFPENWIQRRLRNNGLLDVFTRGTRYRYDRNALSSALHFEFQDKTIGDSTTRLCIPTFDENSEVNVIKTPHHPDYRIDWKDELVDVALKTSAAPTYFVAHSSKGRRYLDGGIWANNPVMVALVDVLTCYQVPRNCIHILSLGCSEGSFEMSECMLMRSGTLHWSNIINAAMKLQSENVVGQAGLLIGRHNVLRVDTEAFRGRNIRLDDWRTSLRELPPEAIKLVDRFGEKIRQTFLVEKADVYQAFHGPRTWAEQ